jgi:hypothetical protein
MQPIGLNPNYNAETWNNTDYYVDIAASKFYIL